MGWVLFVAARVSACQCKWKMLETNKRLSGDGQKYIPKISSKASCMSSCCQTESCAAFMWSGDDGLDPDMRCMTIKTGARDDGFSGGWQAGIIEAHICEENGDTLSISHVLLIVLLVIALYLAFAAARSRSRGQGWVPHKHFFGGLSGLVTDGISSVVRRQAPAGEHSKPLLSPTGVCGAINRTDEVPKSIQHRVATKQGKRRVPGLPGWQSSCNPGGLAQHRAVAAGDAAGLAKLLREKAVVRGGRPEPGCFDDGDGTLSAVLTHAGFS